MKRGVKIGSVRGPYKTKTDIKNKLDEMEQGEKFDNDKINTDGEVFLKEQGVTPALPDLSKDDGPKLDLFAEKPGEEKFNDFLSDFKDVSETQEAEALKASEDRERERKYIERKQKQEGKQQQAKQKTGEDLIRENTSNLFNGALLITFCDFFFPGAIKLAFRHVVKDKAAEKVKSSDVALTPDQVESLGPVSDAAAKMIFEKVNPLALFFVAMTIMYSMNFRLAMDDIKEKDNEKENIEKGVKKKEGMSETENVPTEKKKVVVKNKKK